MLSLLRNCFLVCVCCVLPFQALATAPVVDDSENFAILDEQSSSNHYSSGADNRNTLDADDETPLAHDTTTSQQHNGDLLTQLKNMQQSLQEMQGQLDTQSHEIKRLQQQQLAFYKDLDNRIGHTGVATPLDEAAITSKNNLDYNPLITQPATHGRTNPADEQISYLAAYDLVKNKQFDNALISMQAFITDYPRSGYTANAHYWLGELYMVKKNYPEAINHFDTVLKQFSTSSKAPACSLKIGYALAASGKEKEARLRLQQVLRLYPDTPTAQLAAAKLKTLSVS